MRIRIPLFEFEDLPWFPATVREGMTDYLRFVFETLNLYRSVIPILYKALEDSGTVRIVDLCSGSGGPLWKIAREVRQRYGKPVTVTFTDLFPVSGLNPEKIGYESAVYQYYTHSVNAAEVPEELTGLRTIFSGFHHFDDDVGVKVLQNAVDSGAGIAIFDGGGNRFLMALGILLFHIPAMLLCSPLIRPFRASRLIFTYLVPLIPLCTVWDGLVSVNRLRSPERIMELAKMTQAENYTWSAGELPGVSGLSITYLIGTPSGKDV